MPPDIFLDLVAVRLNGPKAEHEDITINLELTDIDEPHAIHVRHGVLNYWPRHLTKPDATLTPQPIEADRSVQRAGPA